MARDASGRDCLKKRGPESTAVLFHNRTQAAAKIHACLRTEQGANKPKPNRRYQPSLALFWTNSGGSNRPRPTSVPCIPRPTRPNRQNPFNIVTEGLTNRRIGLARTEHKEIVNALTHYFSWPFSTANEADSPFHHDRLMNGPIDRPKPGRVLDVNRFDLAPMSPQTRCHTGAGRYPSRDTTAAARLWLWPRWRHAA